MGLLREALPVGRVVAQLSEEESWPAVEQLLALCESDPALEDFEQLRTGFLERHEDDRLVLGRGVWLPHLRTDHTRSLLCALGRWPEGVRFAWCPEPIHFAVLVVAPLGMVNEYLRAVGMLARAFGKADRYENMRKAEDSAGILWEVLRDDM